jgi:hypothetical protein
MRGSEATPMTRPVIQNKTSKAPRRCGADWWSLLTDDPDGTDRDVDSLIELFQKRYGCGYNKANAALLWRLSSYA